MKKLVSLLLSVVIVFALSACGANDSNTDNTTQANNSGTTTAKVTEPGMPETYNGELPISQEKINLVFAVGGPNSTSQPPASIDLPVYKKYEELTNIKVDWQVIMKDYDTVIKSRIAAGNDIPDIFKAGLADAKQYAADGTIITLEDLLAKNAPFTVKNLEANPIEKTLRTADDGHVYFLAGWPIIKANAITTLLNVKWLDRLNLKTPGTVEDLYTVLKAFKDNDLNNNGQKDELPLCGWMDTSSADCGLGNSFGLQLGAGGYQLDKDGKVTCDFIDPRYKEYLAYINKLYKEDIWCKKEKLKTVETFEYAKANKMGSTITYSTFAGILSGLSGETNDKTGNDPVFVPLDPLKGPYGDQYFLSSRGYVNSGIVISGKCKNKEAAIRYVDFIIGNPEAIILQNYGIEGNTYDKVDGKIVVRNSPKGEPFNQFLQSVGGGEPAFPYTQDLEAWKVKYNAWVMEINDKQQGFYKESALVTSRSTAEEEEQLKKIMPDMKKYISDMKVKFMTGVEPLDKFDEYVAKVKSMGLEQVLTIYQARVERASKSGK